VARVRTLNEKSEVSKGARRAFFLPLHRFGFWRDSLISKEKNPKKFFSFHFPHFLV
jgi:hypothetical protein